MSATMQKDVTERVDFSGQFLVAMPGVVLGPLANSVIYVCEHNENGALGLVINRPTDLTVGDLLKRIALEASPEAGASQHQRAPVFFGGPVQTDRGFVLHEPAGQYTSSLRFGNLALTTSRDVLQDVSQGKGPGRVLVTLGYAGWGPGQLESEIAQNAWLTVSSSEDILFDVPSEQRYSAALAKLGIDPVMLAGDVGHA